MLSGQTKDRIAYNQLSPIQWMAGFCRTIREESDLKTKDFMLNYVTNLLDDATDFSWASAKASHAVVLCRMEQREIQSWSQTYKIDRVCRAHFLDTLWVENFDEIALSCTVKEIEANLFFHF